MSAPGRGPARWLRRGGGALLASAAAHAAAAVAIGGVLGSARLSTPLAGHEPSQFQVELDVDVPPVVTPAAAIPAPQSTPRATPAPTAPAATTSARPARAAPRPRPLARTTRAQVAPRDERVAPIALPSPEAATALEPAPPRFTMSAGTVASGPAPAPPAGQAGGSEPGSRSGAMDSAESRAIDERAVDVAARLLPGAPPAYPPAALEAEIETDVPLEIVVDARGQVISARALTHAGYGLEEAALRAIRGYRFTPARCGGQAVPVRMRWTVQFRLR